MGSRKLLPFAAACAAACTATIWTVQPAGAQAQSDGSRVMKALVPAALSEALTPGSASTTNQLIVFNLP
jgi:hypothetical protein